MINYADPTLFVTEGTTKSLLITDGTVSVSGTSYTVTGATVKFENTDIESESFELTQSINTDGQIHFGSCEAAEVRFNVRKNYDASNSVGKKIKVYLIPNNDASKMLQLGVFKIFEDKQSQDHEQHSITAYDAMYDIINADVLEWYNTQLPDYETTKTIAELRASFLTLFEVTAESVTLVNDSVVIHRTLEVDALSGAEIIKAICEINGVFGYITNEGKFRFKTLAQTAGEDYDLELTLSQVKEYNYTDYWSRAILELVIINGSEAEGKVYDRKSPSASINDSYNKYIIAYNSLISDYSGADLKAIGDAVRNNYYFRYYKPCTIEAIGNPLIEPGDCIHLTTRDNTSISTYVFERKLKGIQDLRDTYTANGDEYLSYNLNNNAFQNKEIEGKLNQAAMFMENSGEDFVETIRNIGYRLLDEPSNVSVSFNPRALKVELNWTDPDDIATLEPVPCTWVGTVVVRKMNQPPKNRWDGDLLVNSTTKNAYSNTALEDTNVIPHRTYYYGIFPYHKGLDDLSNPIYHYRFTKVAQITTGDAETIEVLLKTSDEVVSAAIQDFVSINEQIWTPSWSINPQNPAYVDTLYKSGATESWFVCNTLFNKGEATKMYVDVEVVGDTGSSSRGTVTCVALTKTAPQYWSECYAAFYTNSWLEYTFINTSPLQSLARTRVEIPLTNVTGDFYIMFDAGGVGYSLIREISFDAPVVVKGE